MGSLSGEVRTEVLCGHICDLEAENAKLREQMERLVTLLRVDCDIDASWDGLRRFWNIELTESGCLMRDRVCKAEAENAKLREYLNELLMIGSFNGSCRRDCRYMDDCLADRFGQPDCFVCQELQELGIEVDA
jgi:hypothetical protein